jgi:hypothetical protein
MGNGDTLGAADDDGMDRCEGYYRLENRRCDRPAGRKLAGTDGEAYAVCDYHARFAWTGLVARWSGESGERRSCPTELRPTFG